MYPEPAILSCFGTWNGSKDVLAQHSVGRPPSDVGPSSSSAAVIPGPDVWSPPRTNWVKLNSDASYVAESNEAWWGAVLRANDGSVLSSAWGNIGHCSTATEAEALAARIGVAALCHDPGVKLHLESDCQVFVKGLQSAANDRSELCFILRDISTRLRSFVSFSCSWTGRSGNSLAHSLAQHARISNSMGVLNGDLPGPVRVCIPADCNSLMPVS